MVIASEKNVLNVVVAPLIHKNNILLLQRTKPPFKNLWGLPGGKVAFGEHMDMAVQREILEETGLAITPKRVLAVLNEVFFNNKTQEDYLHTVIFLYEVKLHDARTVKNSVEGELKWFDIRTLSQQNIIPSDYEMIKQIILKPQRSTQFYTMRMIMEDDVFTLDYFTRKLYS